MNKSGPGCLEVEMPNLAYSKIVRLAAGARHTPGSKAATNSKRRLTAADTMPASELKPLSRHCDGKTNSFGSSDVWRRYDMSAKGDTDRTQHHDTGRRPNIMMYAKTSESLHGALQTCVFIS